MGGKRTEVRLPDLGDVDAVSVVAWQCSVGSHVEVGDDLVEVETEKTTFIVPAPASGVLSEVRATKGSKVRVGELLGSIEG